MRCFVSYRHAVPILIISGPKTLFTVPNLVGTALVGRKSIKGYAVPFKIYPRILGHTVYLVKES